MEGVRPEVDGGRFPIKRTLGEHVVVEADVFADGHDVLSCRLRYRHEDEPGWRETAMKPLVNDRWRGDFVADRIGRYRYSLVAWVDPFLTWRHELERREDAADIAVALVVGAELVEAAARGAGDDAGRLLEWAGALRSISSPMEARRAALDGELARLMERHAPRWHPTSYHRELEVVVDRERARFSAWYELFPRSCSRQPGRHATLREAEARLAYVAELGFDVLYLPPIHPIGVTNRKGPNNVLVAAESDPGSPWAIGAAAGGHRSVHPELGTLEDFRHFVAEAGRHGLEVALDIAFQCSPDHPWVSEHPEWFRHRPDGSIQYAENPPKKYQDIYPLNFESEQWRELWEELAGVFSFWIEQGVRIFRVDNPHTKPFAFWEWAIAELKREHPDVIFLSEAFARPRIMYRLAKLGFSQSYTYFTWRNTKPEIVEYMRELTDPARGISEYFRPNFWPNTPDILPEYLQLGGRPAFVARHVLAATLTANYGIYGPAFELLEHEPREPGSEEYRDSEKYQIRAWDLDRPDSIRGFVTRVNRIRRQNAALQSNRNLLFHALDNDELVCFSKHTDDLENVIIVVVNLDPYHTQSGWVEIALGALGLEADQPYQVHDLLSGDRYLWHGARNYVELNPHASPAHILCLRRQVRSERDFEYFF
ncbi:MAG: alpha-1,4-glucan--maltose-1-phosphate maltosyltransferase [Gammaproteobacteria bacterium]|nr:alpha-1,4-glucan--maltose-1-phosphate maltosyltransferase [Gammaproteobacteria bacterium]